MMSFRERSTIGDIPHDSYKRISYVLTDEERVHYSKEESPNVKDLWWDGMDETDVNSFLEIVELTYKRFSSDSDLVGCGSEKETS